MVPAGMTPLRINIDETAACLYQGGRRGNIFLSAGVPAVEDVSLGKRRTHMTLIAIICEVDHIQQVIPMLLVCNERTIPEKEYAALKAAMPPNVHLLRQRSAWSSMALTVEIIKLLGVALSPFREQYVLILSCDAAKIHIPAAVFAACRRWGWLPLLVAAKLTYALQPLDIRAFHPFKIHVQKEYQACRLRSPGGVVSLRD